MLTYTQQDELATLSETFNRRVTQAAEAAATNVMAESAATPGHTERAALADRVFRYPLDMGRLIARAVLNNPNCGSGVSDPLDSDDALLFVVSSLWNAFAGYSAAA